MIHGQMHRFCKVINFEELSDRKHTRFQCVDCALEHRCCFAPSDPRDASFILPQEPDSPGVSQFEARPGQQRELSFGSSHPSTCVVVGSLLRFAAR